MLAEISTTDRSSQHRHALLVRFREELVLHLKHEHEYFYSGQQDEKFQKIFGPEFQEVYEQVVGTLSRMIDDRQEHDRDLEFITTLVKSRVVLEETMLFPEFENG